MSVLNWCRNTVWCRAMTMCELTHQRKLISRAGSSTQGPGPSKHSNNTIQVTPSAGLPQEAGCAATQLATWIKHQIRRIRSGAAAQAHSNTHQHSLTRPLTLPNKMPQQHQRRWHAHWHASTTEYFVIPADMIHTPYPACLHTHSLSHSLSFSSFNHHEPAAAPPQQGEHHHPAAAFSACA